MNICVCISVCITKVLVIHSVIDTYTSIYRFIKNAFENTIKILYVLQDFHVYVYVFICECIT